MQYNKASTGDYLQSFKQRGQYNTKQLYNYEFMVITKKLAEATSGILDHTHLCSSTTRVDSERGNSNRFQSIHIMNL